jgi:hypothetical protein
MTDENAGQEQQPKPASGDVEERQFWYDIEHRDWALQWFVGICNLSGLEMPITLNLAGSYVSGHIVKPEVYFDGLTADIQRANFQGGGGDVVKKTVEDMLSRMKEIATGKKEPDDKEAGSNTRTLSPRYIHLRGARFFVPNDVGRAYNPPEKLWWRGKIESVNGFFLGMPFSD